MLCQGMCMYTHASTCSRPELRWTISIRRLSVIPHAGDRKPDAWHNEAACAWLHTTSCIVFVLMSLGPMGGQQTANA